MNRPRLASLATAACPLLLALAASGCASSPNREPPEQPPLHVDPPPQAPPPPVAEDPGDVALAELDRLLSRWDSAQADGRVADAQQLGAEITSRVAAQHAALVAAARGSRGQAGVYVATMALGFARTAESTTVLVERLESRDTRLVANALIALKLRADPATPLEPIVNHVASPNPDVRRYAPLALGHVLEARRAAGLAPDAAAERVALPRLVSGAKDQELLVRLHVARALGELSVPGSEAPLLSLLEDTSQRVGLGAARALARRGAPEGFSGVVELLHMVPAEAKPMVAGVLVEYAGRLQGRPLTPEEQRSLGTNVLAWSRWHGAFTRARAATPPAR